jgi:hypothetical protein
MRSAPAKRMRKYRARKAAGLRVVQLALPAEIAAALEASGLAGKGADDLDPELEDALVAVIAAFSVTRNGANKARAMLTASRFFTPRNSK